MKELKLVKDLNEYLMVKNPNFEEYPLSLLTTGSKSIIEFCGEKLHFSEEPPSDWKEMIEKMFRMYSLWAGLYTHTKEFFGTMTNEEIVEQYGVGVEEGL